MAKDAKIICPLQGAPCVEDGSIVNGELHACRFWIQVHGQHPQTGEKVSTFDCVFSWVPALLIENSQQQRHTGAAVESFRNEMVKAQALSLDLLTQSKETRLLSGDN